MSKSRSFHELQKQTDIIYSKNRKTNHNQVNTSSHSQKTIWNSKTTFSTNINSGLLGRRYTKIANKNKKVDADEILTGNIIGSVSMQQAEMNYFNNYKEIQQILYDKTKKIAPQNASASINICNIFNYC